MAELLQPADQVMGQTLWVQPLEEVAAKFLVVRSVLQQVIGDDQDRVARGDAAGGDARPTHRRSKR